MMWAMRNIPFMRRIGKNIAYLNVDPVMLTWENLSPEDREKQTKHVIDTTMMMYNEGKALYPRETIVQIEEQMNAMIRKARRRKSGRPVNKILSYCHGPQLAWIKYKDFDGVVKHEEVEKPGATMEGQVCDRPQIYFRTVQELTMPDPDSDLYFVPKQFYPSIGYTPIFLKCQLAVTGTFAGSYPAPSADELKSRLEADRQDIANDFRWSWLSEIIIGRRSAASIDKIVFFSTTGLFRNSVLPDPYPRRAGFLLALATRIRELVIFARQKAHAEQPVDMNQLGFKNGAIPIYMSASHVRVNWTPAEHELMRSAGVIPVESNGELFLKVDATTAVISYHHWTPAKQVIADIARPAIMSVLSQDPDSPRARNMLAREYVGFKTPKLPEGEGPEDAVDQLMGFM
ncbi:hypothetical protein B0T22DRAFT_490736 [Podospora appendiculata]|uniref:SRR1-like domain-containing protein n=1 Tax=Podospora appendiculata TaxID=314037 RepID=A0AAE0XB02_9PEZI|nr:hypothetical protein B0T22DRAFT_490736 [Podospora appendiculata]